MSTLGTSGELVCARGILRSTTSEYRHEPPWNPRRRLAVSEKVLIQVEQTGHVEVRPEVAPEVCSKCPVKPGQLLCLSLMLLTDATSTDKTR